MTDSLQRSPESGRRGHPPTVPVVTGPTILGFPAQVGEDEVPGVPASARLVVLRRPDRLGSAVLVLAGVSTNVSLWLPWVRGDDAVGLALVGRGVDVLGSSVEEWTRSEQWPPLAVVVGGGVLLLLGMLLLVPAHAHRAVGVLALLVALGTAAAVLAVVDGAGWRADRFALGMWFALAVPVLGLLGALKAMLTAPRVTIGGEDRVSPG